MESLMVAEDGADWVMPGFTHRRRSDVCHRHDGLR
jgi:hypothetical protein